jgi:uncharacterized DUF497 family protein
LALIFEWDKRKAKNNLSKHKVSFEEASTIFGDPLSITIDDPLHSSQDEQRFITIGLSYRGKILVVVHCDKRDTIRIIMRELLLVRKEKLMKKGNNRKKKAEMLNEYDFRQGVRGKYAARYAKGSNVVVLEPDVVKIFQNSESVNRALRGLAEIINSRKKHATAKK